MNKKKVLIAGNDGYIGHALTLRLLEEGYKVAGLDNFERRSHVMEMDSFSATPIDNYRQRIDLFRSMGDFVFMEGDLNYDYVLFENFFKDFKPDTIVNLAQQPSAPFSHKSRFHALSSFWNNSAGTINILHFIKEYCPEAKLVQIGSMGEYDHAMGVAIDEGTFHFREAGHVIFPRRPGSFYHASKVAATYLIDCASRWWGLAATDIMQGVVYGNWTPEIEKYGSHTRLDSDEAFGTIVNRFVVQSMLGEPLTVYGKGEHSRGFLALNDSVQCLMLAIENPAEAGEYRTWNQLDTTHTMNEVAETVKDVGDRFGLDVQINHIPSPRVEKTDHFDYKVITKKLEDLGFKPTRKMEEEVEWVMSNLVGQEDILLPLINVIKPQIKWK